MPQLYAGLLFLAAGAQVGSVDQELVESARKAQRNGDIVVMRRMLRGWASLRRRRVFPEGLKDPAARAVADIETEGRLHLYAVWQKGVVSVGLHDPAGIVDRIDVWAHSVAESVRVSRSPATLDRPTYRVDEGKTKTVTVQAIFFNEGRDFVLAQTRLQAERLTLPIPPDPYASARRFKLPLVYSLEGAPLKAPKRDSSALKWWWVAAGVTAVALTGIAIVEEF